jgi:hypothetical protein
MDHGRKQGRTAKGVKNGGTRIFQQPSATVHQARLGRLSYGTDHLRVYFAFSFTYNAMAIIVSLIAAITNGIPLIMWLYVLLAILYLSIVAFTWMRQWRGFSPRVA